MKKFSALLLCLFITTVNIKLSAQCDNLFQGTGFITAGSASGGAGFAYLTQYEYNQIGAAWCPDSLDLNYDFDMNFYIVQFIINLQPIGDGMMFVLQNTGTDAMGDGGANLGYYNSANIFPQSLGVELDLLSNGGGPPYYDPTTGISSHISIVKNGSALPLAGPISAVLFSNKGEGHNFRVTWNHTTKIFSVYLDGNLKASHTNDLVTNIFGGRSKVLFGFTGATGGGITQQGFSTNGLSFHRDLQLKTNALNCGTATISSNAAAGVNYVWSNGETTPTITISQSGNYSLTVSDNNGCSSTASVFVNITPVPTIIANGPVTGICPGTPVVLTASAGSTFSWSNGATTQNDTVTTGGDYSVTVDGCTAALPLTVSYKPDAKIIASGPVTFCPGYSIDLTADSGSNYLWSTGTTSQTITVSEAGNYSVTFDATDGCTKTASQQITVQPLAQPELIAPNGTDICNTAANKVYFNVNNIDNSLVYTTSSDSISGVNSSYYTAYAGTYTVTATDALGCSATSAPIVLTEPPGNPDEFGDNVWNVYFFDNGHWNGGFDVPWQHYLYDTIYGYGTLNLYHGYYTETNISFDTRNRWEDYRSPLYADGFQGCAIQYYDDYFSWSAKRKGFPCGDYSISIPGHDDDAQLLINGVLVWQHAGCCDSHDDVWQGVLGANTTIEFRVKDYGGGCSGVISINLTDSDVITKPVISPAGPLIVCANLSRTLTSSAVTGNLWSTGETTQAINVNTPGNYFVTVTGTEGCTAQSDTVEVTMTGTPAQTYYQDADSDGYGNPAVSVEDCTAPGGYVANNGDCNDANAGVYPGAPEICDLIDNNCDGQVDEGFAKTIYYRDADGDGYGNPSISISACFKPAGYVTNKTDCDDTRAGVHPGAPEICDDLDNNCNGKIDEGFPKVNYYRDGDGDGYGNAPLVVKSCSIPAGYVVNKTDCNDANAAIHPGALDICDGIDNDCDGTIDEDCQKITITDTSATEGNKNQKAMNFTVTLNKTSSQTITVHYTTQDITATAGSDYIAQSGTLTFAPGVKKVYLSIIINGDKAVEPDETFNVVLSNPVNAVIAYCTGLGTIKNDDGNTLASKSITLADGNTDSRSVTLSPNPALAMVYVILKGYTGKVFLQVQSVDGKVLKQGKIQALSTNASQWQTDVSNFADGVYLITVIDAKGNRQTEKLIVQH